MKMMPETVYTGGNCTFASTCAYMGEERDWLCGCVSTLTSARAGVGALRLQEVSFPKNRKQVCNLIERVTVLVMYFYILQMPARGMSISSQIKHSLCWKLSVNQKTFLLNSQQTNSLPLCFKNKK